jgi:hypothetical protein
MSTPTPDDPTAETPAAPDEKAAPQGAAPPPAAPPPAAAPPPIPSAAFGPAASAPAAFTPVPREPWVNPSRRRHIAGVGLVAALACLGAGIGIGLAISGDDHPDRGRHPIVMLPGRGAGYGPAMYGPHGRFGVWPMPHGPYGRPIPHGPGGEPASPVSPAPSSTG